MCGKPPQVTSLIADGYSTNTTVFPWYATLYTDAPYDLDKKMYLCGATIIRENLLITAAHCVDDEANERLVDFNKIYVAAGNIFRDYDSPLHDLHVVQTNKVYKCRCLYYITNLLDQYY